MYLHGTSQINAKGHLEIGGCDTVLLAKQFGTPLVVYDEELIRNQCRTFKEAFNKQNIKYKISYASKAFSAIAMLQLIDEEGLSLDVVSGGELYTALAAGFPPDRIQFHGNNKSREELVMALDANVGYIVIDNFYEIELLNELCELQHKTVNVLLRITPGVHASTHKFIQTGQEDSKFGFDIGNGQAEKAIKMIDSNPRYNFNGLHMHIGSQIFDAEGFRAAIHKVIQFIDSLQLSSLLRVLNVGGGFGIRYTATDTPLEIKSVINEIVDQVRVEYEQRGWTLPEIWVEPGRSIVGEAGTTLYSIGSTKAMPGIRNYIAVDGGMSDNIRPALYQARYEAMLANRAFDTSDQTYSVAGKLCESGDMLIWDVDLPAVQTGDILAVSSTGAYGYSMSSNYNRIPRPAVIFVRNGHAELIIKRETYADIIRNDLKRMTGIMV